MDCIVHRVAKSWTWLSNFHFWRREWQSTPVFLPREFHRQRSLAGCSPWDHKESDTTEWLSLHLFITSNNKTRCPSMSEWSNKRQYTSTPWNTTQQWTRANYRHIPWLNFQGIMNGKSNPKRLHIMPLMWHSWNDKIIGMETRLVVGSSFKERARVRRIKEWWDILVVVMEMPHAFTDGCPCPSGDIV